ncbi:MULTISPECIES: 5-(carboxyamino)imidazole ribonucleotide synthase [Bacillaceae]|uniref:N5-carboxyaminoimidazole ribonucleotide synthase n=1 Tax=Evansella alkalicola TaxID=745819 RepID=A0ABS6JRY7_9BACI|nr:MULTISPECIES: 5-(carboxyamino)imidazole ribonucleotide synthase [Bacillaceae]MBU9721248.1 5-(carboxyamino)imidazole ribonucleotide synthase [Bacillus alkalicola]
MTDMWIEPGKTIGILGGGQLGRMMAISAREMGYGVAVLEPAPNSPCGQIADVEVIAAYDDLDGAKKLAKACHVLTYEFENINSSTASFLEENLYLPQGSDLLSITQDRILEKRAIQSFGVEVVPFKEILTLEDLKNGLKELGLPAVLKTTRGGYDGKGQHVFKEEGELESVWDEMGENGPFVLEAWVPFEKEISVIVTRSVHGELKTFPVAENIHINNILHQSIVPARISGATEQDAIRIATKLAESFNLIGTLAVEMFLTKDGKIFVNELAPRPHNSGHYTINACVTSQFEQHVRAICGWPLGSTELLKPAVMVNLLGEHIPSVKQHIRELNGAHLHLYGKTEARMGRKMGHVTVLGNSVEEILHDINESTIWK